MKNTIYKERMIAMKKDTFDMKKETKEERMIAMKKTTVITLIIGVLIGAALCVLLLKDGNITIPEAAAGFAYLAALRILTVLLNRGGKKEAPRKKTFRSLTAANTVRRTGAYAVRTHTA